MIETDAAQSFAAMAARLVSKARVAAEAATVRRQTQRTAPERAWRSARLLWPLFTKG